MNDEIDLRKVTLNLWDGKWKIIISSIIAFLISLGFTSPPPQPSYKTIVEIKPINSIEARQYVSLNSHNFLNITPQILIDLYFEQIEYKNLFIDLIEDSNIYKKIDYKVKDDYDNAILNLESKIKVLPIYNSSKNNLKNSNVTKYLIEFSHVDKPLWKNIYTAFHKTNENFIRNELIQQFNQKVKLFNQKKILDLENIQNLKNNAISDYDKSIKKRLAYLDEQSQIARKLGVAKNIFETQILNTQTGAVASLSTNTPFYLRGYLAIEKEIELLNNRKDKNAFVNDLFELEKKERKLEQDRTLERVEIDFKSSPLMNISSFVAVNFNIEVAKVDDKNQKYSTSILAIFLGLLLGSIYVLFSNALRNSKH